MITRVEAHWQEPLQFVKLLTLAVATLWASAVLRQLFERPELAVKGSDGLQWLSTSTGEELAPHFKPSFCHLVLMPDALALPSLYKRTVVGLISVNDCRLDPDFWPKVKDRTNPHCLRTHIFDLEELIVAETQNVADIAHVIIVHSSPQNPSRAGVLSLAKTLFEAGLKYRYSRVFLLGRRNPLDIQHTAGLQAAAIELASLIYIIKGFSPHKVLLLAHEEGALLTLRALLNSPPQVFLALHKVILVGAASSEFSVCGRESWRELQRLETEFLRPAHSEALQLLNNTQLLFVHTSALPSPAESLLLFGRQSALHSTASIETRFMTGVFAQLSAHSYYFCTSFVTALAEFAFKDVSWEF